MSTKKPECVWMNGEFVDAEKAAVPILSHALHYGTAVFEGIRAYETDDGLAVFRLREHMHRLWNSAHAYKLALPYSEGELCEATTTLLAKNDLHKSSYIRPIAFKAVGGIELDYRKAATWVAIATFPYSKYFKKEGLDTCVSSWRRTGEPSVLSLAKASGHYVNSALAKIEAVDNGFDEAIFLDQRGFVSEGSGENLFIVRQGILHTPPVSAGILEGITRDTVCTLAQDSGLNVQVRDISRGELYTCDEAFFTGTAVEIMPILSIDKRKIGEGKAGVLTQRMRELYSKLVSGKEKKYSHWLTPVYRTSQPKATAPVTGATPLPRANPGVTNWQLQFWEWTRPQGP